MAARRSPPSTAPKPRRRSGVEARRRQGARRAEGTSASASADANGAQHLAELEREVGRTRKLERLVQNLQVYQEEVRAQNEQLMETHVALEQSAARFADLYEHAPVAYLTLDRSGVVMDANRTSMSLLQIRREGLVGAPFLFLITPGDRPAFLEHMRLCRQQDGKGGTEPATLSVEVKVQARSGKIIPVLLSTRLAAAESGRGVLFRMILTDLSERREAELQFARYQQQLAAMAVDSAMSAERERRRIAVEVHDTLSQTLVLAKMKLAGLMKKAGEAGVREDIARELAAVTNLTEEVLGQTRTLTFDLSPPILYELGFEPALEWLAERTSKRYGLNVVVESARQCAGLTEERSVLLFQVIRELLTNVAKHSAARHVVVRPRCRDGEIHITVKDDGRGFDPAVVSASVPASDGEHGGFGLFSVRTRIEHLGGRLQISSALGGPTMVTVVLPATGGKEKSADGSPAKG